MRQLARTAHVQIHVLDGLRQVGLLQLEEHVRHGPLSGQGGTQLLSALLLAAQALQGGWRAGHTVGHMVSGQVAIQCVCVPLLACRALRVAEARFLGRIRDMDILLSLIQRANAAFRFLRSAHPSCELDRHLAILGAGGVLNLHMAESKG